MNAPDKVLFHLELALPNGETVAIMRSRLQKLFDYYHPSFQATVTDDKANPAIEVEDTSWMTPEEAELLGIDQAALDLLS